MRADDTGGAWVCIGINCKDVLIKWRGRCIWCRVWKGRVYADLRKTAWAEKHAWKQAESKKRTESSYAPSSNEVAIFESSPGYVKRVSRQVPVTTKQAASTFPEIGNDYDIGLVISSACFQPCLPFTHVVRSAKIRVPVAAPDLQATELVDQKEVNHAGDGIGAIHSGGAVLQDVNVINHRKWKQVNVHTAAKPDGVQRTKGHTF